MYALATADMAYTLWLLFGKLLKLDLSYQALRWKFWLYVTNKWVDYLIYRFVVKAERLSLVSLPTHSSCIDAMSSGITINASWLARAYYLLRQPCVDMYSRVHFLRRSLRTLGFTRWQRCSSTLFWPFWLVGSLIEDFSENCKFKKLCSQLRVYGTCRKKLEDCWNLDFCSDIMLPWAYCAHLPFLGFQNLTRCEL